MRHRDAAWKDVFASARKAAAAKVGERGDARSRIEDIAKAQKDSLASLIQAFVDGRIDRDTFDGEMSDAQRALRAELVAVQGISPKGAQAASRAFFDVVDEALATGIRGL